MFHAGKSSFMIQFCQNMNLCSYSNIIRTFVTLNIISMKTKKKDSFMDYIKANRRGSREAEIENHGHPVSFNRVHVSKKVYNRKRDKADARRHLPYSFIPDGAIFVVQLT
jgi:uncharacterized protein YcsI (UPF0317 family)